MVTDIVRGRYIKLHNLASNTIFVIFSFLFKGPKQDARLSVEELNGKIEEARAKGVEDDTANRRANEASKGKG